MRSRGGPGRGASVTVTAAALTENENAGSPHPQALSSRLHRVTWGTPHHPSHSAGPHPERVFPVIVGTRRTQGAGVTFPDLDGTWQTWIWAWVCLSPGLRCLQRPGGICMSGSGRPSRSRQAARRYSRAANGGQEAKGLIPTHGG